MVPAVTAVVIITAIVGTILGIVVVTVVSG